MYIPEALDILQYSLYHNTILITPDDKNALKLGIEALKRLRTLRQDPLLSPAAPLPSETTE